jgi:hypothetical protein
MCPDISSSVPRLETRRHPEPGVIVSLLGRLAGGTMPSEGMQGHEWGAYVVLDTFLGDGTWDGLQSASSMVTEGQ